MSALVPVILPIFIVLGFGYVVVWRGLFSAEGSDALMTFTQSFAIPCLLFSAISTLDLRDSFDPALLGSFYGGAVICFVVGILGARFLFKRTGPESVAIGFVGLFSNSLMLGLPITERAYGSDGLSSNYAIIALHSPVCYAIGITTMEAVRARGTSLWLLPAKVLGAMLRNPLIIGILLGVFVNVTALKLPVPLLDAVALMTQASIPAALFGLGGVLYRYRPAGDMRTILFIVSVSLLLHPAISYTFGHLSGLSTPQLRSAVITSAVAPGVNAYLFANMYGAARRVAASAVLIATALTIVSASFWLVVLP